MPKIKLPISWIKTDVLSLISIVFLAVSLGTAVYFTSSPNIKQIFAPKAGGGCLCESSYTGADTAGSCQSDGSCRCPTGYSEISNSCTVSGGGGGGGGGGSTCTPNCGSVSCGAIGNCGQTCAIGSGCVYCNSSCAYGCSSTSASGGVCNPPPSCPVSKSCGSLGCATWDSSVTCSGVCLACNPSPICPPSLTCSYGCKTYDSTCAGTCIACNTVPNCPTNIGPSCTYGCKTYDSTPGCGSVCTACNPPPQVCTPNSTTVVDCMVPTNGYNCPGTQTKYCDANGQYSGAQGACTPKAGLCSTTCGAGQTWDTSKNACVGTVTITCPSSLACGAAGCATFSSTCKNVCISCNQVAVTPPTTVNNVPVSFSGGITATIAVNLAAAPNTAGYNCVANPGKCPAGVQISGFYQANGKFYPILTADSAAMTGALSYIQTNVNRLAIFASTYDTTGLIDSTNNNISLNQEVIKLCQDLQANKLTTFTGTCSLNTRDFALQFLAEANVNVNTAVSPTNNSATIAQSYIDQQNQFLATSAEKQQLLADAIKNGNLQNNSALTTLIAKYPDFANIATTAITQNINDCNSQLYHSWQNGVCVNSPPPTMSVAVQDALARFRLAGGNITYTAAESNAIAGYCAQIYTGNPASCMNVVEFSKNYLGLNNVATTTTTTVTPPNLSAQFNPTDVPLIAQTMQQYFPNYTAQNPAIKNYTNCGGDAGCNNIMTSINYYTPVISQYVQTQQQLNQTIGSEYTTNRILNSQNFYSSAQVGVVIGSAAAGGYSLAAATIAVNGALAAGGGTVQAVLAALPGVMTAANSVPLGFSYANSIDYCLQNPSAQNSEACRNSLKQAAFNTLNTATSALSMGATSTIYSGLVNTGGGTVANLIDAQLAAQTARQLAFSRTANAATSFANLYQTAPQTYTACQNGDYISCTLGIGQNTLLLVGGVADTLITAGNISGAIRSAQSAATVAEPIIIDVNTGAGSPYYSNLLLSSGRSSASNAIIDIADNGTDPVITLNKNYSAQNILNIAPPSAPRGESVLTSLANYLSGNLMQYPASTVGISTNIPSIPTASLGNVGGAIGNSLALIGGTNLAGSLNSGLLTPVNPIPNTNSVVAQIPTTPVGSPIEPAGIAPIVNRIEISIGSVANNALAVVPTIVQNAGRQIAGLLAQNVHPPTTGEVTVPVTQNPVPVANQVTAANQNSPITPQFPAPTGTLAQGVTTVARTANQIVVFTQGTLQNIGNFLAQNVQPPTTGNISVPVTQNPAPVANQFTPAVQNNPTIPSVSSPTQPTGQSGLAIAWQKIADVFTPPIKPGQIFDPTIEVNNILKVPSTDRATALANFKAKFAYQQTGLANIQNQLETAINKNPDLPASQIQKIISNGAQKYGLPQSQVDKFNEAMGVYQTRHAQVSNIINNYPDPNNMFEAMFGAKPIGKIVVVKGPMYIDIKIGNPADYTFASQFQGINGQNVVDVSNIEDGKFLSKTLLPNSENVVLIENGISLNSLAQIHEAQHGIYSLLQDVGIVVDFPSTNAFSNLQNAMGGTNVNAQIIALQKDIQNFQTLNDNSIADEIIAYLKDGGYTNDKILSVLIKPKNDGGFYDFYSDGRQSLTDFYAEINYSPDLTNPIIDQLYSNAAQQAKIQAGLNAFNSLIAKGYSRDLAIIILEKQPLPDWPKVASRTTKFNLLNSIRLQIESAASNTLSNVTMDRNGLAIAWQNTVDGLTFVSNPPQQLFNLIAAQLQDGVTNALNRIGLIDFANFGESNNPGLAQNPTNIVSNNTTAQLDEIKTIVDKLLARDIQQYTDGKIQIPGYQPEYGCHAGLCGYSSDYVAAGAQARSLDVTEYKTRDLNVARGIQPTDSFGHTFAVVTDSSGNRYLVDLTFDQFIDPQTGTIRQLPNNIIPNGVVSRFNENDPLTQQLLNRGYVILDDATLTHYLDILSAGNNQQPITLNLLNTAPNSRYTPSFTLAEVEKYTPELLPTSTTNISNQSPLANIASGARNLAENLINATSGPIVELAGPTPGGYRQINISNLNRVPIISNISFYHLLTNPPVSVGTVDLLLNSMRMPFANNSLGCLLGSCIFEDIVNRTLVDAYRVLEPGGIVILQRANQYNVGDIENQARDIGFNVISSTEPNFIENGKTSGISQVDVVLQKPLFIAQTNAGTTNALNANQSRNSGAVSTNSQGQITPQFPAPTGTLAQGVTTITRTANQIVKAIQDEIANILSGNVDFANFEESNMQSSENLDNIPAIPNPTNVTSENITITSPVEVDGKFVDTHPELGNRIDGGADKVIYQDPGTRDINIVFRDPTDPVMQYQLGVYKKANGASGLLPKYLGEIFDAQGNIIGFRETEVPGQRLENVTDITIPEIQQAIRDLDRLHKITGSLHGDFAGEPVGIAIARNVFVENVTLPNEITQKRLLFGVDYSGTPESITTDMSPAEKQSVFNSELDELVIRLAYTTGFTKGRYISDATFAQIQQIFKDTANSNLGIAEKILSANVSNTQSPLTGIASGARNLERNLAEGLANGMPTFLEVLGAQPTTLTNPVSLAEIYANLAQRIAQQQGTNLVTLVFGESQRQVLNLKDGDTITLYPGDIITGLPYSGQGSRMLSEVPRLRDRTTYYWRTTTNPDPHELTSNGIEVKITTGTTVINISSDPNFNLSEAGGFRYEINLAQNKNGIEAQQIIRANPAPNILQRARDLGIKILSREPLKPAAQEPKSDTFPIPTPPTGSDAGGQNGSNIPTKVRTPAVNVDEIMTQLQNADSPETMAKIIASLNNSNALDALSKAVVDNHVTLPPPTQNSLFTNIVNGIKRFLGSQGGALKIPIGNPLPGQKPISFGVSNMVSDIWNNIWNKPIIPTDPNSATRSQLWSDTGKYIQSHEGLIKGTWAWLTGPSLEEALGMIFLPNTPTKSITTQLSQPSLTTTVQNTFGVLLSPKNTNNIITIASLFFANISPVNTLPVQISFSKDNINNVQTIPTTPSFLTEEPKVNTGVFSIQIHPPASNSLIIDAGITAINNLVGPSITTVPTTNTLIPVIEPPGLTSTDTKPCVVGNCDGKRMFELYKWYASQPNNSWWFTNGKFTPADFLAMMLQAEAKGGDPKVLQAIMLAAKNQLWANGYCTNPGSCDAGLFNFASAYMESAILRQGSFASSSNNPKGGTLANLVNEQWNNYFANHGLPLETIANEVVYSGKPIPYSPDLPIQWGCTGCGDQGLKWLPTANDANAPVGTTNKCGIAFQGSGEVVWTDNQESIWTNAPFSCNGIKIPITPLDWGNIGAGVNVAPNFAQKTVSVIEKFFSSEQGGIKIQIGSPQPGQKPTLFGLSNIISDLWNKIISSSSVDKNLPTVQLTPEQLKQLQTILDAKMKEFAANQNGAQTDQITGNTNNNANTNNNSDANSNNKTGGSSGNPFFTRFVTIGLGTGGILITAGLVYNIPAVRHFIDSIFTKTVSTQSHSVTMNNSNAVTSYLVSPDAELRLNSPTQSQIFLDLAKQLMKNPQDQALRGQLSDMFNRIIGHPFQVTPDDLKNLKNYYDAAMGNVYYNNSVYGFYGMAGEINKYDINSGVDYSNRLVDYKIQMGMSPEAAIASGKYIGVITGRNKNDLGKTFLLYKQNPNGDVVFIGVVIVGNYVSQANWTGQKVVDQNGKVIEVPDPSFTSNPYGFWYQTKSGSQDQSWGMNLPTDLFNLYGGGINGVATGIIAIDPNSVTANNIPDPGNVSTSNPPTSQPVVTIQHVLAPYTDYIDPTNAPDSYQSIAYFTQIFNQVFAELGMPKDGPGKNAFIDRVLELMKNNSNQNVNALANNSNFINYLTSRVEQSDLFVSTPYSNTELMQCNLWAIGVATMFPNLHIVADQYAFGNGGAFNVSSDPNQTPQNWNQTQCGGNMKTALSDPQCAGKELRYQIGGDIVAYRVTNYAEINPGDSYVYDKHFGVILDKYFVNGKYYFLVTEANSPKMPVDNGTPQTYLVSQDDFSSKVNDLSQTYFLSFSNDPTQSKDITDPSPTTPGILATIADNTTSASSLNGNIGLSITGWSPANNLNTVVDTSNYKYSVSDGIYYVYFNQFNYTDHKIPGTNFTWGDYGCGIMTAAMAAGMTPDDYYNKYFKPAGYSFVPDGSGGVGTKTQDHLNLLASLGYTISPIKGKATNTLSATQDLKNKIKASTDQGVPVWIDSTMLEPGSGGNLVPLGHIAEAIGVDANGNIILNDPAYGPNRHISDHDINQYDDMTVYAIVPPGK